jgi:hypothetical protein
MHQVDNLFEQQQLRRVCSQPCSNQNAVEFSAGKSARKPVLDGCPRREQTNFNVIAKFSQLFELTGNVGSTRSGDKEPRFAASANAGSMPIASTDLFTMLQPRSELLDRSDPSPCSSTLGIERRKFATF